MSTKNQKGLGRGLNVFFGEDTDEIENVTEAKEDKKLKELASSIKEQGVLQPILVVKTENGYTIVAGERRWRASKLAGLKKIPAIIKDYTDTKKKQVALIENIQREDLNVVEVAKAIKELMDIDGYTQAEVATLTGKSLSTVSNITRLLKLQDQILDYVLDGKLVEGHARALLAIKDEDKQLEVAKKVIEKNLTVRDIEKIVYGAEDYNRKKEKKQQQRTLA